MRNINIVITVFFISLSALAQNRNDFTGPKHKNFKPWMHKAEPTLVFKKTNKIVLKGPEIKNTKIWETRKEDLELITLKKSKLSKLTGPAYKNFKS
jgi:hypothetical protein